MKKFNISRLLRTLHRDLGFFMVGVCMVYAFSGILLNHMNGKDPAFKTIEATLSAPKGLEQEELSQWWRDRGDLPAVKRIMPIDEAHWRIMLSGGIGVYNSTTGLIDYELHKKNTFIYWINRLHYNKVKGWNIMADLFAISLIFFAISGLFIVKGKYGMKGRGKWYLIAGLLIPVLYVLLG